MKLPISRTRRKALAVLAMPPKGRSRKSRRAKSEILFGPDGSIMVCEQPTSAQAHAAAEAIVQDMISRGTGESARDALAAVRNRFG